jgi:hypothetical protein
MNSGLLIVNISIPLGSALDLAAWVKIPPADGGVYQIVQY